MKKKILKKKVLKKVSEKKKSPAKMSVSRRACELIASRKYSDDEMVNMLKNEFTNRVIDFKILGFYRFALNQGRMEGIGFPKPLANEKYLPSKKVKAIKKKIVKKETEEDSETPKKIVPKKAPLKPMKKKSTKKKKKKKK